MEILFENRYVRNKEIVKELYRYYYFQRKWLIVCYVLLSISFLANILVSIFEKTYNLIVLICVPLFFLLQLYLYFHQVNTIVKRDAEICGKEIFVETIVTNEYIQHTASTGEVLKLEYNSVRNSVQTKNLILLRTKANLVYIFPKDAFIKGDKESFIRFLNDKGIKTK